MSDLSEEWNFDHRSVEKLVEILTTAGLTEVEWTQGDSKIRLVKSAPGPAAVQTIPVTPAGQSEPVVVEKIEQKKVTSPMVGTLYLSPGPQEPPFVRVGDQIKEGQILFIIEAMKVMNQVRASEAGVVTEICVHDATPVEFGETLLFFT